MLPLLFICASSVAAPRDCAPGNWCSNSRVETRSRQEARSPHSHSSSHWMAAYSSSSATACPGLRAAALPNASVAAFHQLCRVVGSKWGVISPDILFSICREQPKNDAPAALAFQQIVAAANVPDVAEIITGAATSTQKSYGGEMVYTHKSYGSFAAGSRLSHVARSPRGRYTDARRCISACIGN